MVSVWIIPGAFAGNLITLFNWSAEKPSKGEAIKAEREKTRLGNIFTITEGSRTGHKIYVERGVITVYEIPKGS